jgi:predicted pyridoxine 5'-phosphate oxidase superfamily flavin-nucleotide-binding protein
MSGHYADIAFTDDVKAAQERNGSRDLYARVTARGRSRPGADPLTATEREFIATRDGFYVATVNQGGWPYVQYRGGPPGFLRALDDHTLAWADFRGNLQYITTGNLEGERKASLFLMDYARRRRLKLFGLLRVVDARDDPGLVARLSDPDYDAVVERAVVVAVEAYDWNCPQHITQRFTVEELQALCEERGDGGATCRPRIQDERSGNDKGPAGQGLCG